MTASNPPTAPAPPLATLDALDRLPAHVRGEILGGVLIASPRPSGRHAAVVSSLSDELAGKRSRPRRPGGWWILMEPELRLAVDPAFAAVVPDLAGWRLDVLPTLPAAAAFSVVPNWVCEVLSPGNRAIDRAVKLPFYVRAGVEHIWLLDPEERSLEVYAAQGGRPVLVAGFTGEGAVAAAPFEDVEVALDALWWTGDLKEDGAP